MCFRSLIEQTVIEVLGNELCQISVKVAQFFEQQKRQILMTTAAPASTASPTPTPTHLLRLNTGYRSLMDNTTPEPEEQEENENAIYEEPPDDEDPTEDLAAKFAADLCANERIDGGYVSQIGEPLPPLSDRRGGDGHSARERTERPPLRFHPPPGATDSDTDSQRFNPLLVEGFWAPDLTLMSAPKFTS
ncbi:unnamed protein product, partial [Toxocara canis]